LEFDPLAERDVADKIAGQGSGVGFVQTESWIEERPSAVPDVVARLLDQRWLRNGVALSFSLVLDAGLILALISLGRIAPAALKQPDSSIATFDIASVTAQQEGATAATVAKTTATTASKMDLTPTPPPPNEWSMTTLPPASPPKTEAPQPQATAPAPAQGFATTGGGSGAGYDPYAFASYHKPDPARMGTGSAGALQPLPDAVARLIAALRTSGAGNRPIDVRAYVDPMGRVIRAELVTVASPQLARRLAEVAPGFLLCAADPARTPDASLVVTLEV
jgi:hypothetical protein